MPTPFAEVRAGLEWVAAQFKRGSCDPHRSARARASFARRAEQFRVLGEAVGREATIINGLIAKIETLKSDKQTLADALKAAQADARDDADKAAEDAAEKELAVEQPSVSQ